MRSRTVRTMVIALAAMLALTALVGCGDDTAKANAAVEAANAQVDEFNKLDGEITDLMNEIDALGDSEADLAKGVELIDEASAKLDERGATIKAMKAEYSKIGSMDVSEEIKTYATQQTEIADLQADLDGKLSEMLGTLKEMFTAAAAGTLDEAAATSFSETAQSLGGELDALQEDIDAKQKASSDYFDEQGLGG